METHQLSSLETQSEEEKQLSILDLPLEITAHITESLDFLTRAAVRKSCRGLYQGEALAKLHVEQIALFRTGCDEFTLSVKDQLSETWLCVQNKEGENVQWWKDDDDFSFREMKREGHLTPFQKKETPLGELASTLQEYLNGSTIDTLTLDGFHCSDSSMAQLCGLLRSKSIKSIHFTAPFSTTSDARLIDLVHGCPNLRSLTLAAHRCPPKDTVVEKEFLLVATSRLESLSIHSRALREPHSVDNSEVDDDLLLRLLSDKCCHLKLLYYLPLLTAEGIVAVIEHLARRSEPEASFMGYFRSELFLPVWSLIGVDIIPGAQDVTLNIARKTLKVNITVKTVQTKSEYCKIVVRKEPLSSAPNIPIPN